MDQLSNLLGGPSLSLL